MDFHELVEIDARVDTHVLEHVYQVLGRNHHGRAAISHNTGSRPCCLPVIYCSRSTLVLSSVAKSRVHGRKSHRPPVVQVQTQLVPGGAAVFDEPSKGSTRCGIFQLIGLVMSHAGDPDAGVAPESVLSVEEAEVLLVAESPSQLDQRHSAGNLDSPLARADALIFLGKRVNSPSGRAVVIPLREDITHIDLRGRTRTGFH